MLFEDILYPDNPRRRNDIRRYVFELRNATHQYVRAWNGFVGEFNQTSDPDQAEPLKKLVHGDTESVADLLRQMSGHLEATEKALEAMAKQRVKLPEGALDAKDALAEVLRSKGRIGKYDGALFYSLGKVSGYPAKVALRKLASQASLNTILGNVAGAVGGFIVADVVISAITGAVQRREYEDSIDVFKHIHDGVSMPVLASAEGLEFMRMSIRSGILKVGDDLVLVRDRNGEYRRIDA